MLKRVLHNSLWMYLSLGAEIGLGLILTAVLARKLGIELFGTYSYWLAFISIFLPVIDFGITAFVSREVAQRPINSFSSVEVVWKTKFILGVLGLIFFVLSGFYFQKIYSPISYLAFILLAFSQIERLFTILNRNIFRSLEKMRLAAFLELGGSALRLIVIIWLTFYTIELVWVCFALAIVNTIELFISTQILKPDIQSSEKNNILGNRIDPITLLRLSYPFAFYSFFVGMYMKADTLILGFFMSAQAVAWYVSGYKVVNLFAYIPRTMMDAVYPIICKEQRLDVVKLTKSILTLFLVISFPISLICSILSPEIITLIFGKEFLPAAKGLQILSWAIFFVFLSNLFLYLLNSIHQEKFITKYSAVISIFGLVLYFLTIPRWGFLAACYISVFMEIISFIPLYLWAVKKFGTFFINLNKIIRFSVTYTFCILLMFTFMHYSYRYIGLIITLGFYALFAAYEIFYKSNFSPIIRSVVARKNM